MLEVGTIQEGFLQVVRSNQQTITHVTRVSIPHSNWARFEQRAVLLGRGENSSKLPPLPSDQRRLETVRHRSASGQPYSTLRGHERPDKATKRHCQQTRVMSVNSPDARS